MTTPRETADIVRHAYAQWPHIEPAEELANIWHQFLHPLPLGEVQPALMALLREARQFPPSIAQLMDHIEGVGTNAAEDAYAWVLDNLINNGPLAAAVRGGYRVEDWEFPDEPTMLVWRKTHLVIRNGNAREAREAWMSTYRRCVAHLAKLDADKLALESGEDPPGNLPPIGRPL